MRISTVATQYLGTGSVVINSGAGAGAEEARNSSAETNYCRRLVMGTVDSKNGVHGILTKNLLFGTSITSYANKMVKSTLQPSSSSGSPGDPGQRKYVLNKLLMQKMFSDGAPQEPQLQQSPLTVQATGGINGRSSQTKTASRLTPFKGSMTKVLEDLGVPMLLGVQDGKEEMSLSRTLAYQTKCPYRTVRT